MDTFMDFLNEHEYGDNFILLSPKFSYLRDSLIDFLERHHIRQHVIFLSSGTTSINPKGYIISKEAMFSNARSVNDHLGLNHYDQWGISLPPYHVGGISIYFRAALLRHSPIPLYPWHPEDFPKKIQENNVSIVSLVPTQIYDLVNLKKKAPEKIKCVLAGGDFLGESLEQKALDLGWPIFRTFGMSELGSQIATASKLGSKDLKILPIHILRSDDQNRLWIKSESLFSFEIQFQREWVLKAASSCLDKEGYFPLPDRGEIIHHHLKPLGRLDGRMKISGLLIDFYELKEKLDYHMLQNDCWGKIDLIIKQNERKNQILQLEYEETVNTQKIEDFKKLIHPIKIDEVVSVKTIHRNELGKRTGKGAKK
jgi:O-succinylbenzoic acid--CoA ligase